MSSKMIAALLGGALAAGGGAAVLVGGLGEQIDGTCYDVEAVSAGGVKHYTLRLGRETTSIQVAMSSKDRPDVALRSSDIRWSSAPYACKTREQLVEVEPAQLGQHCACATRDSKDCWVTRPAGPKKDMTTSPATLGTVLQPSEWSGTDCAAAPCMETELRGAPGDSLPEACRPLVAQLPPKTEVRDSVALQKPPAPSGAPPADSLRPRP